MEKYICVVCVIHGRCGCVWSLPITDTIKKAIAQKRRLFVKICRDCGARNVATAVKCRKCRGRHLRWKKREIVK
jgi:large subunit ribosomal protein L40e